MTIETFSQFLSQEDHRAAAILRRLQDKCLALKADILGDPWTKDPEWFPPNAR